MGSRSKIADLVFGTNHSSVLSIAIRAQLFMQHHPGCSVCQLLQNHLNECIVTVRAKSPEKRSLEHVVEEESGDDSLATNDSTSKMTIIESSTQNFDAKRDSTLTNGSTASSIEFDTAINVSQPNDNGTRKLKSIVQYQC
uniref:Rho-GAP domain-containing protein n=1 Tax=Ascaris lumbricoides TaxID=6252 RepID=A0A0M3IA55_ASCLU